MELREEIWMRSSGATVRQAAEGAGYYQSLVSRLKDENYEHTSTMRQIEVDVPRTFGTTQAGVNTPQGREKLERILKVYALRNRTLGYCQSMNLVVGLMLSIGFAEESAFWLLVELAERIVPGYWVPSMTDTQIDTRTVVDAIEQSLPEVTEHLHSLNIPLDVVVWQHLLSLFINKCPTWTTLRVLDVLFYEGSSEPLLAFTLCLVRSQKPALMASTELPEAMDLLMLCPANLLDVDQALQRARDCYHREDGWLRELRKTHQERYQPAVEKSLRNAAQRTYSTQNRLPPAIFEPIYNAFVEHAELASSEHGIKDYRRMTRRGFSVVLSTVVPELSQGDAELLEQTFRSFDSDDSGVVDLPELMIGATILLPSPEECTISKPLIVFDLFDVNGDHVLSRAEILHMLRTVYRIKCATPQLNLKAFVDEQLARFSTEPGQSATELKYDQIMDAISTVPQMLDLFT